MDEQTHQQMSRLTTMIIIGSVTALFLIALLRKPSTCRCEQNAISSHVRMAEI